MISSMDQRSNSLDTKTSHFFVDQIGCISTIQSIASHNEHCVVYTVCVAMDAALSAGDRGRNGTLSESTWIWFIEKLLETTGSDDPSNIDPPHALNVTVPGNVERESVISSRWFSGFTVGPITAYLRNEWVWKLVMINDLTSNRNNGCGLLIRLKDGIFSASKLATLWWMRLDGIDYKEMIRIWEIPSNEQDTAKLVALNFTKNSLS